VKRDRFCANAGFFPDPGSIEICQIQGFPFSSEDLEPLKWSRLLVKSICDWAGSNIPELTLTPYERNGWDRVAYNSKGNSKLVYDVTAEKEGFTYDPIKRLFVKRNSGGK
jgi:hypothetical protein